MADMHTTIEDLGSAEQAKAYRAYRQLEVEALKAGAPGNSEARKKLAGELTAALTARREDKEEKGKRRGGESKYSLKARSECCRLLGLVGAPEAVAVLARLLNDFDLREVARAALARIGGEAAATALAKAAVEGVGPEFRVGAIASLARCHCDAALQALATCVEDSDPDIRIAAAEALAAHPEPQCDALIVKAFATPHTHGRLCRNNVNTLRLRLAGCLANAGKKEAAQTVYKAVLGAKPTESQRKAAERALAAS